ncbi:MAG TPA: IS3 family transposase [Epulopiscium sp.]|nr:IS3 family transposase [Candidatus Epulonipiscium sp.]
MNEIIRLYELRDGTLGYRRMTMFLNRKLNTNYNHKRIYRLMRILGLKSVIRVKKNRYVTMAAKEIAKNKLNREFTVSKVNEKWLTDVTEFKYGHGKKAYLSAILDLYDNSIIAYKIGHRNSNDLVFNTFNQAIKENPNANPMVHSDQGYQYTSYGFKRRLQLQGMQQSMYRAGKCIDNGPIENFWGIVKTERYYLREEYFTFEDLKEDIKDYIDYYNKERYQKRLNNMSPLEYRAHAA